MFGSDLIDAAIGLLLVYLLFSALCSALNEWIVGHLLHWRSRTLEKAVGRLLTDADLARAFFRQPLIRTLASGDQAKPSYLSASLFVDGLIGLIRHQAVGSKRPEDAAALGDLARDPRRLLEAAGSLNQGRLREVLEGLLGDAATMADARARLEAWFNEGMDRASGWYQKNVRICMAGLAVAVAVLFNVDTLTIARELMRNSRLRATLVAAAGETVQAGTNAPASVQAITDQIQGLGLPIGWSPQTNLVVQANGTRVAQVTRPGAGAGWGMRLGGWLLTAGALSLGAPFWFDLLGRIMNLRASGKKPG